MLKEEAKSLWCQLRDGDENAFLKIYRAYYQDLYALGLSLSADKSLTKECIQQVFTDIWSNRITLSEVENVKGYLLTCLRNMTLRQLTNSNRLTSFNKDIHSSSYGSEISVEQEIIEDQRMIELRGKLLKAMDKLTIRQKELIERRFLQGMSYEEIEEETNLTRRTIYNHIHMAIQILKNSILFILLNLIAQ
ncbi:sigma-70 family RNA polymerase sigma factor [Limibacter armeniacum]|uniref:RNA polymerase sigma factor n=1 Tax=Limibacter armeniacum TaxID=466084 RepID=UPI002FE650BF